MKIRKCSATKNAATFFVLIDKILSYEFLLDKNKQFY